MHPMAFPELAWHLINFIAPALAVALLSVAASRLLFKRSPAALSLWAQIAINSIAGGVVLAAALWLAGSDSRMLVYAALVLACASVQWFLGLHWKS
jgi:hypothetical protein